MRAVRFTIAFVAGVAFWAIPATAFCGAEEVKGWIGRLSSEDFKERVEAQERIQAWAADHPAEAKDLLLREHEGAIDPEVKIRLRESLTVLVVDEYQKSNGQGYLGIVMEDLNGGLPGAGISGVLVKQVVPGSPADLGGLKVNDIIVALGNLRCDGLGATTALVAEVKKYKPGAEVKLEALRGAEKLELTVKLAARPMGLPERQQAGFQNGLIPPAPDLELLGKLEKEAQEAFFKDWLDRARRNGKAP